MKILVVSNMYPSANDPTFGVFVKNFFEYVCIKNGHNNTKLAAIKGKGHTKLSKLWKYIVFYVRTTFLLFVKRYDLVYIHTVTFPVIPLRIVSVFKEIPMAFNIHGSDWITHSSFPARLKKMALPLVQKAKFIVVPSAIFRKLVIDEMPQYEADKIIVSYSGGIDISHFRPVVVGTKHKNTIVIGYVSRIIENKGWRLFIEALSLLKKQHVSVKGLMAGGGEQEQELLQMISDKGLCGDIEYLGAVSPERLPEIYNQMDMFVFPTLFYESLGLVGIEAMACGVPVIGTNQGGLREYIEHGVNGFLFEKGNVVSLCSQISNYISMDEEARISIKRNAIGTATSFSRECVMENLMQHIYAVQ